MAIRTRRSVTGLLLSMIIITVLFTASLSSYQGLSSYVRFLASGTYSRSNRFDISRGALTSLVPSVGHLTKISRSAELSARGSYSYDDAKARGETLLCLLRTPPRERDQSKYTRDDDLQQHGWTTNHREADPKEAEAPPWEEIFKSLGLSTDKADNVRVTSTHNEDVIIAGRRWQRTNGIYENFINTGPDHASITAHGIYSPEYYGEHEDPPVTGQDITPLKHWSDVTFINYQSLMADKGRNAMHRLRYIFQARVGNRDSVLIIETALGGMVYRKALEWPGTYYGMDTAHGLAILGSPNGLGAAWLLIQHKEQLGRKTITGVRVFMHAPDLLPCLCFYLEDLSDETPEERSEDSESSENHRSSKYEVVSDLALRVGGSDKAARSEVEARIAGTSEAYNRGRDRGDQLLCWLQDPSHAVRQSEFLDLGDLKKYGWTSRTYNTDPHDDMLVLGEVYEALKLSTDEAVNHVMVNRHELTATADGRRWRSTGARYEMFFSVGIEKHAIVAYWSWGPQAMSTVPIQPADLVPLSHWSDVAFLNYKNLVADQGGHAMHRLRYVFQMDVTNDETYAIIQEVVENAEPILALDPWPGQSFSIDSDDEDERNYAKALIGRIRDQNDQVRKGVRPRQKYSEPLLYLGDSPDDSSEGSSDGSSWESANDSLGGSRSALEDPENASKTKLIKRVDSVSYEQALDRATLVLCALQGSDGALKQSIFTKLRDLAKYGWSNEPEYGDPEALFLGEIFDHLGLSIDNDVNYYVQNTHDRDVEVDGRNWRSTGGEYKNYFSVGHDKHAIIATWNFGPRSKAHFLEESDVIPLRHWSDIVFLDYKILVQRHGSSMRHLQYVFHIDVTNDDTDRIIQQVIGEPYDITLEDWPGHYFSVDDRIERRRNNARALVGSPNGLGVAMLLATHREEFERKTIVGVTVFKHTANAANLCFHLGDLPDDSQAGSSGELTGGSAGGKSSRSSEYALDIVRSDNDVGTKIAQRSVGYTYQEAMERGDRLLCELQKPASAVEQSQFLEARDLRKYGWTTGTLYANSADHDELNPGNLFEHLGLSIQESHNFKVTNVHDMVAYTDGRPWPRTGARYVNIFSVGPGEHAIIAYNNFSPRFLAPRLRNADIVPLKQWSDVVFLNYKACLAEENQEHPMHLLHYIFRMEVMNTDTTELIAQALGQATTENLPLKPWPGDHFNIDSADEIESNHARALLGSPNGLGAAWLLAQHKNQLGLKTITAVTVYDNSIMNIPNLCFHIADVQEETSEHPQGGSPEDTHDSTHQKDRRSRLERHRDVSNSGLEAKRPLDYENAAHQGECYSSSEGAYHPTHQTVHRSQAPRYGNFSASGLALRAPLDYEDAIRQGDWYLCLQNAPPHTVTQSKYTEYSELERYGWTVSAYESASKSMWTIFEDLGLPKGEEAYTRIQASHNKGSSLRGHRWPPTMGRFTNFVSFGHHATAIVASYNFAPSDTGPKWNPETEGEGLVPLRQWSDVVFLVYQALMRDHGGSEAMKRLKYVFRMNIVTSNHATQSVLSKVMESRELTIWPGVYFSTETDEAKALLATPHGWGVSWLLIQHKHQLGRKVVKGVTIFTDTPKLGHLASKSLCFHIEDWKEGMTAP